MLGNEFDGARGDGKWVNIGVKGIDAFIKGINMHIGTITVGGRGGGEGGELEVESNVSTLLLVPNIEATSIYTFPHLTFDYHEL
jgi:hypothetical protein